MNDRSRLPLSLLAVGGLVLMLSRIGAYDPTTWLLEVFPIFLIVPVLLLTARRFPLTPLLYFLILVHAVILMIGGHWTYARVPAGFWVQELLGMARNPYDRLGHFAQGFVPAIAAREIYRRRIPLPAGKWLFWLVCCTALAISAGYEFIEWWTAVAMGSGATDFLGTQGDIWDTQWDMFTALVGSIVAQALLGQIHERQLAALAERPSS